MSGYLNFNRTGVKEVDDILTQIENAGDMFHHTSQWQDEIEWMDDKRSCVDRINEKIDIARINLSGKGE